MLAKRRDLLVGTRQVSPWAVETDPGCVSLVRPARVGPRPWPTRVVESSGRGGAHAQVGQVRMLAAAR